MNEMTTLIIWIAAAIFAYAIAQNKGRNPWIALAFGLLFGFITVIYYWIASGSRDYELEKAQRKVKKLKNNL